MIRKVELKDAKAIVDIYNYYILNTNITFEVETLKEEDMKERIQKIMKKYPYIVYEDKGQVLGYAYLGEFKSRAAYRFSVESSIYLDINSKGKGIGKKLYEEILELAKGYDIHTIIAGITIPNEASIGIHEKLGFKKVAHFEEVGYKEGKWLDVGYWQKRI